MKSQHFKAEDFTPTKWDTADDKATFANHFVRFVEKGCPASLFPKWFYKRLSNTFGHIAHYDLSGFYQTWFETTAERWAFIQHTLRYRPIGDPLYTYSDVERRLIQWLHEHTGVVDRYQKEAAAGQTSKDLAQLARLKAIYEPTEPRGE